ncbi:MAG: phage portal protein [Vicinamibacterales bacterium]
MASLLRSALARRGAAVRDVGSVDDYIDQIVGYGFGLGGTDFTLGALTGTMGRQTAERVAQDFEGFARAAYAANGPVFACLAVRMAVFSTIRFAWQRINRGRPAELFGTAALGPLEEPWTGGTTQDLLVRKILHADLAGNAYTADIGGELVRMRPDWVLIVTEPRMYRGGQVGWRKIGYVYFEGGVGGGNDPVYFLPDEVSHFAPLPDPIASYRGMSWLTPVVRELQNDKQMGRHQSAFYENAATPNLSVSLDKDVKYEAYKRFRDSMEAGYKGPKNAGKTLYLGGGADVRVIGSDFRQLDFSGVQGRGETRIASAAGVPPVIAGFSEGLASATYSNYSQARRRFADGTMHPLWQNVAGSLAPLIAKPSRDQGGAVRLWYDTSDVPFLREDRRDAAEIQGREAETIRTLIEAGHTPESSIRAVQSGDWSQLQHTGLVSVQLQAPGSDPAGGANTEGGTDDA